jgi:oxygen-independent coproporphyrinogen-3 oxidase
VSQTQTSTDHDLLAKYDGRAPRYTSYPTAAQFTGDVGPGDYETWLAELPHEKPISLYVHIPFCQRLCWFCGCNTRVIRKAELLTRYVEGLRAELALIERVRPDRLTVAEIHLGGGTPNLLSRDDLVLLFSTIRHVFKVRPGAEISAECDPVSMTQTWAQAAAFHGVTRVSFGVQDLNPSVQAAVNRVESYEQVKQAVEWVRQAGIPSVNFDLMYGLPKQTTQGVADTITHALTLRPDRVALFGYAHVPWMKPHQFLIHEEDLPNAVERLQQAEAGAQILLQAGYEWIGLDHFALPSDALAAAGHTRRLHRNFQGYTTDPCETLIAIGASGISKLPQGYVQNQTAELAWRAAVDRGELPTARGVQLTEDDRFRADIIDSLMCHMGVNLAETCARHQRQRTALIDERLAMADFVEDGLITRHRDTIHVTQKGRPFVRAICAVFDRHLRTDIVRHSTVV